MIFLLWLICAGACAAIASSKGRSGVGWFFIGLLLTVIALVVIACLPSLRDTRKLSKRHADQLVWDGVYKRCPDCAELIQPDARVCKHCGYRFDTASA